MPTFSGKYTEWVPFHDLFKSTVDANTSLSNIQKLQYLKTSLRDEPAQFLSHLPTSNNNYEVAMKLLEDRYDNTRMIIRTHLDAIIDLPDLKQGTSDALRKMVTVYVENTMAISAMGLDTGGDYIWVHLLAKKMDDETRKHWELYAKDDAPQSMKEMTQFLEERARALDFSSNSASNSRIIKDKFEKRLQQNAAIATRIT